MSTKTTGFVLNLAALPLGFLFGLTGKAGAQLAPLVICSLFVVGTALLAKAKGYSPFLGILGLFTLIGWAILAFLPDLVKEEAGHE